MPGILNEELADTLCTVITMGFMVNNKVPRTQWIYEPEDGKEKQHKYLEDAIKKYYSEGPSFIQQAPKEKIPIIVGHTPKTELMKMDWLAEELNDTVSEMEKEAEPVNAQIPLYGAYLGGMASISKASLVGVSDVYLYTPKYRQADDKTVGKSYENARRVSNAVSSVLKKLLVDKPKSMKKTSVEEVQVRENGTSFEAGNVFGSVHGMTRALVHFSSNTDTNKYYFEIALSDSVGKVGSCVPCAIFMEAVGNPASAIHVGRGDNWNFPKNMSAGSNLRKQWNSRVVEHYQTGMKILAQNAKVSALNTWFRQSFSDFAAETEQYVPEAFLEALTFEKTFIDRMMAVL